MDNERSRLTSITEQDIQQQVEPKTQITLLKVYHQLYCADQYPVPSSQTKAVFARISEKVNRQNPTPLSIYHPFNAQQSMQKAQGMLSDLLKRQNQQKSKVKYFSSEELAERLRQSQRKNISTITISPIKKTQSTQMGAMEAKQKEYTADTKASVSEILSQLKQLDNQRSDIKYIVYSQDTASLDYAYERWGQLHSKMKQTLEQYIDAIGNGISLTQIFLKAEQARGKTIDGLKAEQVYAKLETFLQSLYLDERQLLLYRDQQQKSLTVRSCPSNARKRLIFD